MEKLKYERPVINKISAGITDKFGMGHKTPIINKIEGHNVTDLIKKYGSPVFVISEGIIRNKYNAAKQAFTTRYPKVQFAWSYKTNYLNAICKIYHSEGSWAEVVSGFEYDKAIENGVSGKNIIFNGPEKSTDDLTKAIKNGSYIHIDHFDELFEIIKLTNILKEKPKVAVRVNMDTGIYPKWDRFGFNYENGEAWNAINRIMLNDKLELVGLHTHIGTYITSTEAYNIAASKLADLVVNIDKKYNHKIKYIDLGGGFASENTLKGAYLPGSDTCPSFDDYADAITNALINSQIDAQNMPTLFLETGRALIDDAGYVLGTVIANKRLANGRRSMIIDIGVNMLFTSFWYEHEIYPVQQKSSHSEDTTIYGPLCMNIDIIRSAIKFPLMQKNDNIVLKRIGAYNMTQWMQFITMRPKIILLDTEGNSHIIRENETKQTLTALEKTPSHL